MKYQLVLQFAAASMEDFDRLVALEDRLTGELDNRATVDGHDFGLGEFNIANCRLPPSGKGIALTAKE